MKNIKRQDLSKIFLCFIVFILIGGCFFEIQDQELKYKPFFTKVKSDQRIKKKAGIESGESIAIGFACVSGLHKNIEKLVCKKTRSLLKKRGFQGIVMTGGDFRQAAFKDVLLDPNQAILDANSELFSNKIFKKNVSSMNVRLLVVLDVSESKNWDLVGDQGGGLIVVDKFTRLRGEIIDLKKMTVAGEVSVISEGTASYGILFIIPVIKTAHTRSSACRKFSKDIANFITRSIQIKKKYSE